jgi:hypothetical protein
VIFSFSFFIFSRRGKEAGKNKNPCRTSVQHESHFSRRADRESGGMTTAPPQVGNYSLKAL